MTLFGALGGLFFKQFTNENNKNNKKLYFLFLGCLMYGIGAILNVVLLRFLPYTTVFPLTSITYIWTMVLSFLILDEKINRYKFLGLLFIIAGTFLLVK
ncbi:EamA family transporter [Bacillus sp. V59.32b]|uniref:EamA family transporter n=1 Tax=Bacillus sp. V59.32b TaxID=1758642 RepID=UPI000E3BCC9C|nr:EamA family transporter [Bacillus sp. V59.32b]RFU66858.1 multidrug transporter [Bacillus sp. V59.32b]